MTQPEWLVAWAGDDQSASVEVTVAVDSNVDIRERSYAVFEKPLIAGAAYVHIVGRLDVAEVKPKKKLGQVPYAPTLEAMRAFTAKRDASTADELWVLEHPPVYTLGQGADARTVANGIAVVRTDRGGDITYHGPGQIVGYPIIDLREWKRDVVAYVRAIEEVVRQGKEALVLVPEISLTPQTIRSFQGHCGQVAVLHSHLQTADRGQQWRRIARGEVQVIVGARKAGDPFTVLVASGIKASHPPAAKVMKISKEGRKEARTRQ